jgi:hypothetical protein
LDIREDHQCVVCQEASDAKVLPVEADDFACLGPIDFAVLRASIRRAEESDGESAEAIAFAGSHLEEIASAHGQELPPDVREFVARHPL